MEITFLILQNVVVAGQKLKLKTLKYSISTKFEIATTIFFFIC
jgi:hypothetical protein